MRRKPPGEVMLRRMAEADLATFERWLRRPHFARWFLQDATVESEIDDNRRAIRGEDPAVVLVASLDGRDIGWCQWYRWWDDAEEAADYRALPGEIGIDYGIGEPDCIGLGIGTGLVATLVAKVRAAVPGASILAGPAAGNRASRRVLEKNGFTLVDVRDMPDEPNASPLALYRLASG